MFKRSGAGLAVDLTDKIKAEADLAPFSIDADPIGNYALDRKQYCVPAARAPQHVYINKSMMDDAGVTLGESWTVDEFVEVARKLTKSNVFGTLTGPPLARPALGPNYLYTAEGKSNFDNPWFARELELALQLQKDKIAMDRQTIIAEKLQTFSQNPFIAGRVAMLIQSGQIIRSINDTKEYPHDFQTYCMPIPLPEKGKPGWNTGQIGDLISISPKSQNADAAWDLAKFWMRNAGKYMTRGGRLPALVGSTTPDDIVDALLSAEKDKLYDVESWKTMLFSDALQLPVDTVFTAGTEIQTINMKLIDETLLGDRTVASWAKEAVAQSDAAIGKAK